MNGAKSCTPIRDERAKASPRFSAMSAIRIRIPYQTPIFSNRLRRSESLAVLSRVDEASHHPARVAGGIQSVDPIQIKYIRFAPQVTKVFHHCVGLVEILRLHFRTIDDLSQYLPTRECAVVQAIDQ